MTHDNDIDLLQDQDDITSISTNWAGLFEGAVPFVLGILLVGAMFWLLEYAQAISQ